MHLNRSRLYLNQNGSEDLVEVSLNFIENIRLSEASKRVKDVSSAFTNPTSKDKRQAGTEMVDYITNTDLKSLRMGSLTLSCIML